MIQPRTKSRLSKLLVKIKRTIQVVSRGLKCDATFDILPLTSRARPLMLCARDFPPAAQVASTHSFGRGLDCDTQSPGGCSWGEKAPRCLLPQAFLIGFPRQKHMTACAGGGNAGGSLTRLQWSHPGSPWQPQSHQSAKASSQGGAHD